MLERCLQILTALGQKSRLKIYALLLKESAFVGAIATSLDIGQSATSQHLKVLEKAGLVESKRRGKHVWYEAKYSPVQRCLREEIPELAEKLARRQARE